MYNVKLGNRKIRTAINKYIFKITGSRMRVTALIISDSNTIVHHPHGMMTSTGAWYPKSTSLRHWGKYTWYVPASTIVTVTPDVYSQIIATVKP